MSFKSKLKSLREAANLTQQDLATRMKVPSAMISHYECGQREPGLKNLNKLIAALGCQPNDLMESRPSKIKDTEK